MTRLATVLAVLLAASMLQALRADTVALWLFDEPASAYPSTMLNDCAGENIVVLGRGGALEPGRFGNALHPIEAPPLTIRSKVLDTLKAQAEGKSIVDPDDELVTKAELFGLVAPATPAGRSTVPLHWGNATFAAMLTAGERHLRKGGFPNPTTSRLNLGEFDWTLEFWFRRTQPGRGVVFEVGQGPRGENSPVTQLWLDADNPALELLAHGESEPARLAATANAIDGQWHHWALVHQASPGELTLFIDGKRQNLVNGKSVTAVPAGDEGYMTLGTDGRFENRLPGMIDELRFSDQALYTAEFDTPDSFSVTHSGRIPTVTLTKGPPLLFEGDSKAPYNLGTRKHLFIDDALVDESQNIAFVPSPPQKIEQVIDYVKGHLTVVDDEAGQLRIYYKGPLDSLAVLLSKDGVKWEKPDLGSGEFEGEQNIVITDPVGLGVVFLDPNGPPEHRWKYVSGIRRKSIFLYTSSDGFSFTRHETAALPFAAGSQSAAYYDDQRQLYVAHHRSDYGMTPHGSTRRRFLRSETADVFRPWPYDAATPERTAAAAKVTPIKSDILDPWFLDNGPLCPPGLSIELPTALQSDDELDQEGTDIYVTKALKYPWAPDTYLAFPSMYYHYWNAGPRARQILGEKDRKRGSGVAEVQLAVSRDGRAWHRYPRPTYVPSGGLGRNDVHEVFMTHGMVRRGDEIWQYFGGHGGNGVDYHSAWNKNDRSPIWRAVQRVDGFVAAEAPYSGGHFVTKPLVFQGSRLHLNVDASATGFVQVGIQDEKGEFLDGFHVDDCIYVNGDFLDTPLEWLEKGTDVSALSGKPVRLYFRVQGAKVFAFEPKR